MRSPSIPRLAGAPAAFLAVVGLIGAPFAARADSVTGANGAPGAAGAPCQAGAPGGEGGDAVAGTTGAFDNSNAQGGSGASGGKGGDCPNGAGGDGGAGGAGGDASALASQTNPVLRSSSAFARGGSGGAGGAGGVSQLPSGGQSGVPGDGGRGGDATASATAAQTAGIFGTSALATAQGGNGGTASGAGARAGDGGTASGSAFVSLEPGGPTGFITSARLQATGGAGGSAFVDALAGRGGSVSLVDRVDGRSTDLMTLSQIARGGNGGFAATGSAGAGGDALSALDRSMSLLRLMLEVEATGGHSGRGGPGAAPVPGGSGTVDVDARNDGGDLVVRYLANGGEGSTADFFVTLGSGGRGGEARADVRAVTSGDGHRVTIGRSHLEPFGPTVGAFGGAGGDHEGQAGVGGNAITTVEGIAEGNSEVDVLAFAVGGAGGLGNSLATELSGSGGDATAIATGRNAGASTVRVTAEARGGSAAAATTGGDDVGRGGTATASAHGESSGGGNVIATASATGGDAVGAAGGSIDLRDAVSGATTGALRLVQEARGGNAANSPTGIGGDARSALTFSDSDGGRLDLEVLAVGGVGTLGNGAAHAEAHGTGMADVGVLARAQGLDASRITLGPVFGESLGGGRVRVEGEVGGFAGELDFPGVDAIVQDAVDGATTGVLELVQRAVGGAAGTVPFGGTAPDGGAATSRLTRARSVAELIGHVEALGGAGALTDPQPQPGLPTDGGDALAESDLQNDIGIVRSFVYALGGSGGAAYQPIVGGKGGDAQVRANASTSGDGHEVIVGGGTGLFGAVGGEGIRRSNVGGARGTRGVGGDANSASTGTALGNSRVTVYDRATGGFGGSGGSAFSDARGSNQGGERVSVLAEAIGGNAEDLDGAAGDAHATARGTSTSGDVDVTARQTSGAPGNAGAASGVAGIASQMTNAVSGATAGTLTLTQRATGARGGSSDVAGGAGGSASSSLDAVNEGGGALVAVSEANGGAGGISRGVGGEATASVHGTAAGASAVDVTARARGGVGGWSGQGVGGSGGAATLGDVFAQAESSAVTVVGEAIGGDGGAGATAGGDGASVSLDNVVRGETSGALTLIQRAIGGNAGRGGFGGAGGHAGSATSHIDQIARVTQFSVTSYAAGGNGGDYASSGDAADAEATVVATNESGALVAIARAEGGDVRSSNVVGAGGRANVSVLARTQGDGHDVRVGDPESPTMGAFGGAGGLAAQGHGGGGDATSTSSGIALGDSRVDVYDLAVGGTGYPGSSGAGGDASSSASAITAGRSRALAQSTAIGGAVSGGVDLGNAIARADSVSLGEAQSSASAHIPLVSSLDAGASDTTAVADARAQGSSGSASASASSGSPGSFGPFFSPVVAAQAFASAPVLVDATASARAGAGPIAPMALAAPVDAMATVAGGSTQRPTWGSAAFALTDTQEHEGSNITLHAEAEFSGTTTPSVLSGGLAVSFLSVDLDASGFDSLVFRVSMGESAVLERVFDDASAAVEFFSQALWLSGLSSPPSAFPGEFDLHFIVELTSNRTGSRFGTTFALGTEVIPEPNTGALIGFGLLLVAIARRRAR